MKRNINPENTSKIVISLTLTLIFLTITSLYYFPLQVLRSIQDSNSSANYSPPHNSNSTSDPSKYDHDPHDIVITDDALAEERPVVPVIIRGRAKINKSCDLFKGGWVPNPNAPYYTNDTCWAIHDNQNCIKFGRPDTDFMKWRWQPNDCNLPIFNPSQFLEIVRGKSLAFLGDSVGRNQMQSLMCLLNRVTYAVDVSPNSSDDKSRRWSYPTHNFTLANFWSPYLVNAQEVDPKGPTLTGLFRLDLDTADTNWIAQIEEFDYVIVSAGHWFFRPAHYYLNDKLVGCHYCLDEKITDLTMYYGYKMAFRTTFRNINTLANFRGTVFLRTFAPSHFENGEWDKGGDCVRKSPIRSNGTRLDGMNLELYMTQMEEFRIAEREGGRKGLKYLLLDTTEAMLLRPDGHPSRYGHYPNDLKELGTMKNDCVHWCLPGPVDTWNDFLLHILKMAGARKIYSTSTSNRMMDN